MSLAAMRDDVETNSASRCFISGASGRKVVLDLWLYNRLTTAALSRRCVVELSFFLQRTQPFWGCLWWRTRVHRGGSTTVKVGRNAAPPSSPGAMGNGSVMTESLPAAPVTSGNWSFPTSRFERQLLTGSSRPVAVMKSCRICAQG